MSSPTLVRDVMRPPVLAPEGMWVQHLVRLLHDRDTELLTIVDTHGLPVGAVTEEDIVFTLARRRVEERPDSAGITARELMGEAPTSVAADQPAAEAARLMRRRGLRHLAVVDPGGRPVGVVGRGDLLAVLPRPDEEIRQDVDDLLARKLPERAASVAIVVCDGMVFLRRLGDTDFGLEDVLPDVLETEGVLAARVAREAVSP